MLEKVDSTVFNFIFTPVTIFRVTKEFWLIKLAQIKLPKQLFIFDKNH